jgi:hypothetical protein
MIFPSHITSYKAPGSQSSSSEDYSLDYSGLDEIRKRRDAASELEGEKQGALYRGDLEGSMKAGRRIKSLLSEIGNIEPVRLSSYRSSGSSDADGEVFGGEHADLEYLKAMAQMAGNRGGAGGGAPPAQRIAAPPAPPRFKPPTAADVKRGDRNDPKTPGLHMMTGDPPSFLDRA